MAKNVNVLLSLVDKFSAPMQGVVEKTKDAQREMKLAQNQLKNYGKSAQVQMVKLQGLTGQIFSNLGFMKLGEYALDGINTFTNFDRSMKALAATSGIVADETNADYKAMMDKARELGATTSKTAAESADAMNYMKLAGWSTEDVLKNVDKVLMLSEASGMDLAQASDAVTDSMSALGLQTKDTARYLDVVAKAQQSSNMTAAMLMDAYKSVGGVMNSLKVPIEDSATALGVLANRGIKAAEGGNSLSAIMTNLTSGTGAAGKELARLGISAFDADGNFKGLKNVLMEVNKVTQKMTQEERTASLAMIGGKEQLKTLNALMSGLNTTTKDGTKEWDSLNSTLKNNSNGAMKDMAQTMRGSLKGAIDSFRSAIEDTQITLVNSFAPALDKMLRLMASDVLPKFNEFMKYLFTEITPEIAQWLTRIAPLIAGTVAQLATFKTITFVVGLYETLTKAVKGYTVAQGIANVVMSMSPVGWIALGVGALASLLVWLWQNWDEVTKAIKTCFDWFDKFTTKLTDVIKVVFEPFVMILKDVANGLSSISKVKIFGGKTPNIEPQSAPDHNALGTSYFKGGQTFVGEGGRGELINLPSGSQIIPHDVATRSKGEQKIEININVQGNMIGNDDFINQCGEAITQRLTMALGNM